MLERIRVTLSVVSPLFMYGADQNEPEIRAASLKGMLRFWYRAIALGRLKNWEAVREEENRIFGSAEGGQAQFLLKIDFRGKEPIIESQLERNACQQGLFYMGYGPISYNKNKPFIKETTLFDLVILFKPDLSPEDVFAVELALQGLCYFGGVGSRSRRGFGSLNIVNWEASYQTFKSIGFPGVPKTREELKTHIQRWQTNVGAFYPGMPDYTAFSEQTRSILYTPTCQPNCSAQMLLKEVGNRFIMLRSYGQKINDPGGVANTELRQVPGVGRFRPKFKDDHDLMFGFLQGEGIKQHPRRVVFGLPHNYHYSSGGEAKINAWSSSSSKRSGSQLAEQRRGSPLFFHVHELDGGQLKGWVMTITMFPAKFLPDGDQIRIDEKINRYRVGYKAKPVTLEPKVDYGILTQLLDQFEPRLEVFEHVVRC
ncbi:MAG: type III-B CRISPR module RAMP protein Cmr1 [Desulfitobacteriaceae bacterium]|nr:type III-B CRISPR module RAMP protein Cmr1 [Desulfitobacteriaceae bacterium]MDI6915133.1 type III-B CRISPR module RAMP protein Cmr1 [Desulfitobacteriaceae bacterium]